MFEEKYFDLFDEIDNFYNEISQLLKQMQDWIIHNSKQLTLDIDIVENNHDVE